MTTTTYTAHIGGASVNVVAGTLSVTSQIGQRSQGSLGVWSALGVYWQYGTQVQVYDASGALAFAGYTTKDEAAKSPGARQGTGYLEHTISLMDNCYRADKRRAFKTYLGLSAGAIVRDLLTSYLAAEGVTSTAASIATGPIITEVIWSGSKSVSEALTWLAQQAGYWWQIDKNGVLWFQPYGGVSATVRLDGTQIDAMQDVSVTYGNDMYVNRQYAKGAYGEKKNITDSFSGNSQTRSFTCSYPLSSHVVVSLNGVSQPLGVKGVDNGQPFYWAVGDAVVAQDPSGALLTSSDTLVISYNGRYPVLAMAQNNALISAQRAREGGGTGLVESVYTNTKVHTLAAAFQVASAMLAHYGQDTTILTFSTQQEGFQPGQMLTVNLSDYGLATKSMLIDSVTIDDQGPDGFNIWYRVAAVGSPVESAQWQTYWQNLMNQSSDPTDFEDVADTALAFISNTSLTRASTVTVTHAKHLCPIIGNSTIISGTLIIC